MSARNLLAVSGLALALAAGASLPAAGRTSSHFALVSLGVAGSETAIPASDGGEWLPPRLKGTSFGDALHLAPEYFLGEMRPLFGVLEFSLGGKARDYGIKLTFSDPVREVRAESANAYGQKIVETVDELTMNAIVSDSHGKIAFSGNFNAEVRTGLVAGFVGEACRVTTPLPTNSCGRLIRTCLSHFAEALKNEFTASCRVRVCPPADMPEFDSASVEVCLDGEETPCERDCRLCRGNHELCVEAAGCETVRSEVSLSDDRVLTVKLKRK